MNKLLMIRPIRFAYNAQTAINNAFQEKDPTSLDVNTEAQEEFDAFVEKLKAAKIDILALQDSEVPHTPDSIFPNNWISFHEDGRIILYPMFAKNRRLERKPQVLEKLHELFEIDKITDLSVWEQKNHFLEGTGSFVLDRPNKIAYACVSPRTDPGLFTEVCKELGYEAVLFEAFDRNGQAIYHTNVMMCVADRYVVINLESIPHDQVKQTTERIKSSGKQIFTISHKQMEHFAGNMLQVPNKDGILHLVMSTQAWESLSKKQQNELSNFNPIVHSRLDTIEKNGGGSARCMMAEIYLKNKSQHKSFFNAT